MRNTLLALPVLLALGAAWASGAEAAAPKTGERAPRFALRELSDNSVLVSSKRLFEGRTTLLSFFATSCEPCKEEIPELLALERRFADREFRVVLVCLDRMGVREVDRYLEEAGAAGRDVLWDRYGRTREAYGVVQLPTNVLVGPDEKVISSWELYRPEKVRELERYLEGLPTAKREER